MDTEQIFAMDRDKKYFLALVVVLLVIIGILVTLLVTSWIQDIHTQSPGR